MSLLDFCTDFVDVYRVDDRAVGPRLTRDDSWSLVQSDVRCQVHETGLATHNGEPSMLSGREVAVHKVTVLCPDPIRLGPAHRIVHVDPVSGITQTMKVIGTVPRKSAEMPDVVQCLWYETGE